MSADLHEVDAERRALVAQDVITAAKQQWLRKNRRPAALSAREGLAAVQCEAGIVWMAAANIRKGVQLTDADFDRLSQSMRWIDIIGDEVLA